MRPKNMSTAMDFAEGSNSVRCVGPKSENKFRTTTTTTITVNIKIMISAGIALRRATQTNAPTNPDTTNHASHTFGGNFLMSASTSPSSLPMTAALSSAMAFLIGNSRRSWRKNCVTMLPHPTKLPYSSPRNIPSDARKISIFMQ